MVIAENLSKHYGLKAALDSLSLSVEAGQVLGFIGPNGAGKTTTMRILAGTMPASSGSVKICGFDIAAEPLKAKSVIGYLPENAPLYPHMKVMAFLEFCASMRGIPRSKSKEAIASAVASCSLEQVLDEELESLSKGFRRRVCLAQAIVHSPAVLLLDEPTDGLDPIQKQEIRSLIRKMREGRAIIISTHILEELDAVCDRVLAISVGRKVFDGSKAEFKALGGSSSLSLSVRSQAVGQDLVSALKGLASAEDAGLVSEDSGLASLWVKAKPGSEGRIALDAFELAKASGWTLELCRENSGERLDEVFARLMAAKPAAEEAKP